MMKSDHEGLRVLKIAPTPFFADRGCHVRILEEVNELQSRGCRVLVCTYHHGRDIEGVAIRRSMKVPWYRTLAAGPSIHKLYVDGLLLASSLRAAIQFRPHVIHAHLHEGVAIGWVVSRMCGAPLVADLQGSLTGELVQHNAIRAGGFLHTILYKCERMILRLPAAIMRSSARATPFNATNGKTPIIDVPDCADCPEISVRPPRGEMRAQHDIPPSAPLIGYLGLLNEYQGVGVLLDAAMDIITELPEARILVMGYPNVEQYQQRAAELGIETHCVFTGRVNYAQVSHMLSMCDIAVSPKLAVSEGNGKLLTYMGAALPVVATDTEINRELLGDSGVYVAPSDSRSLASAVVSLLRDPARAQYLGRQLRQRAETMFSRRSMGDRILHAYMNVLKDTGVGDRLPPQSVSRHDNNAMRVPT